MLDRLDEKLGRHVGHAVQIAVQAIVDARRAVEELRPEAGLGFEIGLRIGHEDGRELQEPWVDAAAGPGEALGHHGEEARLQASTAEPCQHPVDGRAAPARADGCAQQAERAERGEPVGGSHGERGCGQCHRSGLRHAQQMHRRLDGPEAGEHHGELLLEAEIAAGHRHVPGVGPVEEIDLAGGQQRSRELAEDGARIAGIGGDDEDRRARLGTAQANEPEERPLAHGDGTGDARMIAGHRGLDRHGITVAGPERPLDQAVLGVEYALPERQLCPHSKTGEPGVEQPPLPVDEGVEHLLF